MGSISSTSASTWGTDGEDECLVLAVTWDVTESHLDHLRRLFPKMKIIFHKLKPSYDPADIPASSWEQMTVLLTYCILPPTPESAPRLRFIQLMSAGSNHIQQLDYFKSGRVPICSANGLHGPQIAEYVMGTVLSFNHQFPRYLKAMEARKWDGPVPLTDDGGEAIEDMVGKRIGILGYGAIGRQIARVASGMGMDVLAYTFRERSTVESRRDATYAIPRTGDPDGSIPSAWYHGSSIEAVNKFLGQDLDVLVISLPLTQFTRGLISAPQFEILSTRRTFVVSVARGAVVNTSDIYSALENGLIAGAALDVTDPEPLPADHPLWGAKNIFITPHVSGDSARYKERLLGLLASNISRVKEGMPLQNVVDRHLGY